MILYLDSHSRKITDEKDRKVSLDNAKVFWFDGKVEDCSLSFERLASFDFDFNRLERFYEENQKL